MKKSLRRACRFFGRAYIILRLRLANIALIRNIYSKYSFLQRLDHYIVAVIESSTLFMETPVNVSAALSKRLVGEVQELLEKRQFEKALEKGRALHASGAIINSYMLVRLTQETAKQGYWKIFDEVLLPSFKRLAFHVEQGTVDCHKNKFLAAVEDASMILLENARLQSCANLVMLAEMVAPRPVFRSFVFLLNFIQSAEMEAIARGQSIRDQHPSKEINQIASIVWGETYIQAFMQYNVRSMLAKGNMPALQQKGLLIHSIVTTERGKKQIMAHPAFVLLEQCAQVEFFCFPESLLDMSKGDKNPDKFSYLLYGILDHINLFFARGLRANVFLIPVDSIVANPSFTNMRRYLEEGFDCCGAGNLVAEREAFLPALDAAYGSSPVIEVDTRSLATTALKHPHHYIVSQLIHDNNKDFGRHPRELFWPTDGGILVHSIYTHPLAISARAICKDVPLPFKWVDSLLPPRLFSSPKDFPRYKIIENAEEAYINNFAPADRKYETTGRAFNAYDFALAHTYSYPVHRYMLNIRQFIPCDYAPLNCRNDIDEDMRKAKKALSLYFPDIESSAVSENSDRNCHLCASDNLEEVIDLGFMPLSHHLRSDPDTPEKIYPVRFHYCNQCGLLQIRDTVPPEALYDADTYSTGFQKPKHIDDLIVTAIASHAPGSALDIGCNDGSLLAALSQHGFTRVMGIEPNTHAAEIARGNGFNVYTDFLNKSLASQLKQQHKGFDYIFARHVLEHVEQIGDFFECVNLLLNADGHFVMELPHVEVGFEANNPVILWEEHVNYFTEPMVQAMLEYYGFEVVAKRYYAFGGGSIAFVAKRGKRQPLDTLLTKNFSLEYFRHYAHSIQELSWQLNDLVDYAQRNGHEVAVYGAAPRSCTILNYAKLGYKINHVIDDRDDIQGRLMPGTRGQITSLDKYDVFTKPLLVLLGVGCEHEHKVLSRLKEKLGYTPVSVSLFPPRDIWQSIKEAKEQLVGAQAKHSPKLQKTA